MSASRCRGRRARSAARRDLLLLGGLGDQRLGERRVLAVLHGPADGVAAEHVEDHVEVEARPLRRALQLRDVPGPELVRSLGEQLRLGVAGWVSWSRRSRTSPSLGRAAGTSCAPTPGSGPRPATSPRPARASSPRTAPSAARPAPPRARRRSAPWPAPAAAAVAWARAGGVGGRSSPAPRPAPGTPGGSRPAASAPQRSARSSLGALGRALGPEQLPKSAETFPCTSITRRAFDSSASARSARRRNLAFSASNGFGFGRPAGAPAPPARRRRAACATHSTATSTAPRDATAHRSHRDACTPRPRAGSAACTQPRTAAAWPLDQLRIGDPRRRAAPGGHCVALAYGSLHFAPVGPIVLHVQHPVVLRSRPQGSVIAGS